MIYRHYISKVIRYKMVMVGQGFVRNFLPPLTRSNFKYMIAGITWRCSYIQCFTEWDFALCEQSVSSEAPAFHFSNTWSMLTVGLKLQIKAAMLKAFLIMKRKQCDREPESCDCSVDRSTNWHSSQLHTPPNCSCMVEEHQHDRKHASFYLLRTRLKQLIIILCFIYHHIYTYLKI